MNWGGVTGNSFALDSSHINGLQLSCWDGLWKGFKKISTASVYIFSECLSELLCYDNALHHDPSLYMILYLVYPDQYNSAVSIYNII